MRSLKRNIKQNKSVGWTDGSLNAMLGTKQIKLFFHFTIPLSFYYYCGWKLSTRSLAQYSSLWNMPTKSNIQWRQKLNCFLISNRLECLTNSEPIHFCLQNMNLGTKYEIRSGVILHNFGQSKSGLLPYQWSWLVCNASVPHFSFSLFLFPLKKQTPQTVNDQLEWWIC